MTDLTTPAGGRVDASPSEPGWDPLPVLAVPSEAVAEPIARRVDGWHPFAAGLAALVACYLALASITLAVGLLLVEVIVTGGRWQWDVIGWNRWFADRFDSTMDTWSGWMSRLADTTTVVAVAAVLVLVFLVARRWQAALFLGSVLTLEVTVFLTMTLLVDRVCPDLPKPDEVPPTSSYPSGHTAAGTALYLAIALLVASRLRSRAAQVVVALLGLVPGVLVAIGRMALLMHHPTDVIVGYALGLLCVLAGAVVVTVTQDAAIRRRQPSVEPRRGESR